MRNFDPDVVAHQDIHRLLVGGVAPRPIALVATMDTSGNVNLSPFSFFNVFGVNPAIVCFSPAYSGRTGKAKDTMLNLLDTRECTVSVVNFNIVHQISLASAPYERGVDEFVKSGLTKLPSVKVAPPGVAESPFVMEAKLLQHVAFGEEPGSANMMICEIVMLHVSDSVMNESGGIDPRLIDQVARLGGPYYTRARDGLFVLPQPGQILAGIDSLPEELRNSPILTGQHLAQLASLPAIPEDYPSNPSTVKTRHKKAALFLEQGDVSAAWTALVGE